MGCDIHWYVEVHENGIWKLVYPDGVFCYLDEHQDAVNEGYAKPFDPVKWPGVTAVASYGDVRGRKSWDHVRAADLYIGRHYDLFSLLANCGRGSFECLTGENRGIPKDCSNGYLWEATGGNVDPSTFDFERDSNKIVDWHSHNWCTLAELLEIDWDNLAHKEGCVSDLEFLQYKIHGRPKSWSGSVGGGGIKFLSDTAMCAVPHIKEVLDLLPDKDVADSALRLLDTRKMGGLGSKYFCKIKWTVPYRTYCANFIEKVIPAMRQLGSPEDVRAVYFFDN